MEKSIFEQTGGTYTLGEDGMYYTKDQPRRFPRFSVQFRHYTENLEAHAAH